MQFEFLETVLLLSLLVWPFWDCVFLVVVAFTAQQRGFQLLLYSIKNPLSTKIRRNNSVTKKSWPTIALWFVMRVISLIFLGSLRLLSANGFELLVFLEGFFGLLQKLGKKENTSGNRKCLKNSVFDNHGHGRRQQLCHEQQQFRGKREELCNLNITFE